jgi:hypothetical protein
MDNLPDRLQDQAWSLARKFYDGEISSADAALAMSLTCRHPFNGLDYLTAMHAEFDATVESIIFAGIED